MVSRAVLMKFGLVSINIARQNISKTAVLVNTARQVNAAHSKTIVNAARPMSYLSKTAHSTVKRPIHKNTTFKNSNINQRVNTVRGKKFNTARPKAVVNAVKGNNFNAVKASACWVWKPKYKVLDHVSKHNINPQIDLQDQRVIDSGCSTHMTRNMSYLTDYEEIDRGYVAFGGNPKGGKITRKAQLHDLVDGKKIIVTDSSVRRDLQLADEEGVDCEGSTIPTDPHHTPTIIQPSNQPQKRQKTRKPKRKDTQLGDSLVRVATTISSLEAEQDSGNITKTRSKATPNESSSLGTTLGGGPRCQETMGDTIAQTRFENVSKHSNDSLLAKGNTLRSDEDRLKLNELMALCTTLQNRVLDLEKTKTTQQMKIASLKKRVKKLAKKSRSRTHKLKRLYKVGLTARVESSGDEESLGEDASKQGRINAIDADEEITLVSVQDDADKEMFDVDALNGEEVFVAGQNENVVEEVVDVAQVSTAATTVTITTEEITLAQALEALKTSKPKVKGIVFQEPGKSTTTTTTISSQQSHDKGKGIMIKETVKPIKKKDQISFNEETALKLKAEFDEEERLAREKAEKEKEANIALI
ncbi:hypothetical protein Tco_0697822, partial [Tanacetum coccineum]